MSKKTKFLTKLAEIKKEIASLEKSFKKSIQEKKADKEKKSVIAVKKISKKKVAKKTDAAKGGNKEVKK